MVRNLLSGGQSQILRDIVGLSKNMDDIGMDVKEQIDSVQFSVKEQIVYSAVLRRR